jgi:hypothetical protein
VPKVNVCLNSDAELRAAMNVVADQAFCKEIKEVKERILGPKPQGTKPAPKERPKDNGQRTKKEVI